MVEGKPLRWEEGRREEEEPEEMGGGGKEREVECTIKKTKRKGEENHMGNETD